MIFALISTIDGLAFNKAFYAYEYQDLKTAQTLKMSEEDLFKTTDVLLDYTKGQSDSLECYANIDGSEREVFNEREKMHMVDVRNLYLNAKNFSLLMAIVFITSIILLLKDREIFFKLFNAFKHILAVLVLLISVITFYVFTNFYDFWVFFHEIFFTNDLFYLDPKTSILIQMVPEQFFTHLVLAIILVFGLVIVLLYFILDYLRKRVYND